MNKSSIYEKIEEKGQNEVKQIISEGEQKAEQLKGEILQEAQKRVDKLIEVNKNKNADILKTKMTEIKQLAKQKALTCKKELINKTFQKASEKLLGLSNENFIKLVIKMIKSDDIKGNEILKVSSLEFDRYLNLFSKKQLNGENYDLTILNQKLGPNYHLQLAKDKAAINGGFIIVSENFDIDNSYPTILNDLSETMETKVAEMLFTENRK